MILRFPFIIKDFYIDKSYENDSSKISIAHTSGESGDFSRDAFEEALYNAILQFYKENF